MDHYLTYAVALLAAMFAGGFIGFLLWAERSRPSVIALGAGGTVMACLSLAASFLR